MADQTVIIFENEMQCDKVLYYNNYHLKNCKSYSKILLKLFQLLILELVLILTNVVLNDE